MQSHQLKIASLPKFVLFSNLPHYSIFSWVMIRKKQKSKDFCFFLVAGVGIEPHDLRVMSPTSYQLLYPAILDCKYTDNF